MSFCRRIFGVGKFEFAARQAPCKNESKATTVNSTSETANNAAPVSLIYAFGVRLSILNHFFLSPGMLKMTRPHYMH